VPLAAPEGLTPGGVGQKDCNGPLASDMHGEGMADTRTFYPSKQHNPFLEVGVDDKVQDALIKSNNLWVQGDEPSVISPKASLGVKHGSNPICPYERISAGLVEGVSDHNLGLVTTSPSSKGTQSLSAFKVYVRRKGSVAANHMAHVNLNPGHYRDELDSRNMGIEIIIKKSMGRGWFFILQNLLGGPLSRTVPPKALSLIAASIIVILRMRRIFIGRLLETWVCPMLIKTTVRTR